MRRAYPDRPIAAVGAVVLDGDQVLLVRRGHEPLKGAWSLPGGGVELGETLEEAVCREVREETGLVVAPVRRVAVLDRIDRDAAGRVLYHYVLIDYLCRVLGGSLRLASDASAVRWIALERLEEAALPQTTVGVIRDAVLGRSQEAR